MERQDQIVGVANALAITMSMLVDALDKQGAISKAAFAQQIRGACDKAERDAPEHMRVERFDLFIMRSMAKLLHDEAAPGDPSWEPVVIEGGAPGLKLEDED